MLHEWPYQEDCLTPDGYVVLPAQTPSEPPPARAVRTRRQCQRGHPFTPTNTLITATGRRCWTCLGLLDSLPPAARRDIATGKRWHELPRRGAA